MHCVICNEDVRTSIDEHVDSHLAVSDSEILACFKRLAAPSEVRLYKVTCADPRTGEIFFSLENAKLFMGFAERRYRIPWAECCEWLAFHEKAHIRLRALYSPPAANPNIISAVEDYYIEERMLPKKYRRVYEAHVRLIVAIRKMRPLPMVIALRDADAQLHHYLTFASWCASNVISLNDVDVDPPAVPFIETAARGMREIESPRELAGIISFIHDQAGAIGLA